MNPLHDLVLVELDEDPNTTASGLTLVSSPNNPRKGTVIATGPGTYAATGNLIPVTVKVGDRVLLRSTGGTEIKDITDTSTTKRVLLRDVEILATL